MSRAACCRSCWMILKTITRTGWATAPDQTVWLTELSTVTNLATVATVSALTDLNVEYGVGKLLKQTMALCEQEQDYVTRSMLQKLLDDTENGRTGWNNNCARSNWPTELFTVTNLAAVATVSALTVLIAGFARQ